MIKYYKIVYNLNILLFYLNIIKILVNVRNNVD